MCRFALYLGPTIRMSSLVTEPANSIIHQSFHSHEREEPLNGDGFGVAWYAPGISPQPAVFKDVTPAWNNMNLLQLARVTESGCLLAHVRAATHGSPVTRVNCHPFAWGPFAFMHNGHVGNFPRLQRRLREELSNGAYADLQGTTDSEILFAFFRDLYLLAEAGSRLDRMVEAVVEVIRRVEQLRQEAGSDQPSLLNLALTDGQQAVATRYVSGSDGRPAHSLYVNAGKRYVCEQRVGRMLPSANRGAALVSSEPLCDDGGWHPIPRNHLVTVDVEVRVEVRPIEP